MKKILGLVALFVLIILSCFYFFPKQPKNIFDEIYQETEKTYRSNNVLRHIDGFKIRPDWPSDDPNILYTPFGLYNKEKTPSDYSEIEIRFNFEYTSQLSSISFERQVGPNTAKDLDSYYDEIVNQKVLKDWCTIYDSKYSPSNYGEVKVETQWENW